MIPGKTKAERWKNAIKNPALLGRAMMEITPLQQLHTKVIATLGTIIGLLFAWVFMFIRGMWYFSIAMFFILVLQFLSYIGARQEYKQMLELSGGDKGEEQGNDWDNQGD